MSGTSAGTTSTFAGALIEAYVTSPRIVKVPQKSRLIWDGPGFDATAGQSWSVVNMVARGLYRPYVQASFRNGYHAGLQLQSCFEAEIDIDGSKFLDRVSSQASPAMSCRISDPSRRRVSSMRWTPGTPTRRVELDGEHRQRPYLYGRTIGARVRGAAISCSSAAFDLHSEALDCSLEAVSVTGESWARTATAPESRCGAAATRASAPRSETRRTACSSMPRSPAIAGTTRSRVSTMPGSATRSGSAASSPSIKSKRNRVLGGSFRIDNNRAAYIQNADGVIIEGGYFALTGAQTAPNLAILDGAASVTLRRCTLDLTDYTGSASVDYAAFAAASTLNILEIEEPIVIDPNGKLRSWFNAANTSGVIVLKDIPKNAAGKWQRDHQRRWSRRLVDHLSDHRRRYHRRRPPDRKHPRRGEDPDGLAPRGRRLGLSDAHGTRLHHAPGHRRAGLQHPGRHAGQLPGAARALRDQGPGDRVVGAARDLALTDDRMVLRATHATPTLTIRNDSNVPYPAGMMLAGTSLNPLTIALEAGVTVNGSSSVPQQIAQEALACGFSLRKNAMANSWTMVAGLGVLPDAPAYTAPTTVASAILSLLEATANGTNKANIRPAAAMAADADITLPGISGTLALLSQVLRPDTSTALAVGYDNTEFSLTLTGTVTPAVANGYKQKGTNNAAFTLAVPRAPATSRSTSPTARRRGGHLLRLHPGRQRRRPRHDQRAQVSALHLDGHRRLTRHHQADGLMVRGPIHHFLRDGDASILTAALWEARGPSAGTSSSPTTATATCRSRPRLSPNAPMSG